MHSPVFGLNVSGLPGPPIVNEFSQHQRGGRIGRSETLLGCLLASPELAAMVEDSGRDAIAPHAYPHAVVQRVAQAVNECMRRDERPTLDRVLSILDGDAAATNTASRLRTAPRTVQGLSCCRTQHKAAKRRAPSPTRSVRTQYCAPLRGGFQLATRERSHSRARRGRDGRRVGLERP